MYHITIKYVTKCGIKGVHCSGFSNAHEALNDLKALMQECGVTMKGARVYKYRIGDEYTKTW